METKTLLDIMKLRVNLTQGNPTEETVLNEVVKALERLIKYENNYAQSNQL